jgi:hypothetical protein
MLIEINDEHYGNSCDGVVLLTGMTGTPFTLRGRILTRGDDHSVLTAARSFLGVANNCPIDISLHRLLDNLKAAVETADRAKASESTTAHSYARTDGNTGKDGSSTARAPMPILEPNCHIRIERHGNITIETHVYLHPDEIRNLAGIVVPEMESAQLAGEAESTAGKAAPLTILLSVVEAINCLRVAYTELDYPENQGKRNDSTAYEDIRKSRRAILEALNLLGYTEYGTV